MSTTTVKSDSESTPRKHRFLLFGRQKTRTKEADGKELRKEPVSPDPSGVSYTKKEADATVGALVTDVSPPKDARTIRGRSKGKLPASNWLTRTRFFGNLCNSIFHYVDDDGSGTIDEKELYSGLLMMHLKLATYAGPAACKPLSREKCHHIFVKMDVDGSGALDREEFRAIMMVLCSNVLSRVLAQWVMTLMIVPLIAQQLLNAVKWVVLTVKTFVTTLDEHSVWADRIELFLEAVWNLILTHRPAPLVFLCNILQRGLSMVPQSVKDSLPLSLLSAILVTLLVPWLTFNIDDYFQSIASGKDKNKGGKVKSQ